MRLLAREASHKTAYRMNAVSRRTWQRMFAWKVERKEGGYLYFYPDPQRDFVRIHGVPDDEIVEVRVREVEGDEPESEYWGYVYAGKAEFEMIWPSLGQLDMCFPYGLKAAEESGDGQRVNLVIEEVRTVN